MLNSKVSSYIPQDLNSCEKAIIPLENYYQRFVADTKYIPGLGCPGVSGTDSFGVISESVEVASEYPAFIWMYLLGLGPAYLHRSPPGIPYPIQQDILPVYLPSHKPHSSWGTSLSCFVMMGFWKTKLHKIVNLYNII